jgi:hypothetical protein
MSSRDWQANILLAGLLAVLYLPGLSTAQAAVLFDLREVADKPRGDVEKILGKPSAVADDVFRNTRGSTYAAIRANYLNGAVVVTYLEGGARYLTIWVQKLSGKYRDYSYPTDAWTLLGDLGIDRSTVADLSNPAMTRWRDLPGIYDITVFPTAERKLWYVHVLTSRIYE